MYYNIHWHSKKWKSLHQVYIHSTNLWPLILHRVTITAFTFGISGVGYTLFIYTCTVQGGYMLLWWCQYLMVILVPSRGQSNLDSNHFTRVELYQVVILHSEGNTKGLRSSNPIDPIGQDVSECFNKVVYVKSRGSFGQNNRLAMRPWRARY